MRLRTQKVVLFPFSFSVFGFVKRRERTNKVSMLGGLLLLLLLASNQHENQHSDTNNPKEDIIAVVRSLGIRGHIHIAHPPPFDEKTKGVEMVDDEWGAQSLENCKLKTHKTDSKVTHHTWLAPAARNFLTTLSCL
jgi:hypothetical protein